MAFAWLCRVFSLQPSLVARPCELSPPFLKTIFDDLEMRIDKKSLSGPAKPSVVDKFLMFNNERCLDFARHDNKGGAIDTIASDQYVASRDNQHASRARRPRQ